MGVWTKNKLFWRGRISENSDWGDFLNKREEKMIQGEKRRRRGEKSVVSYP